MFNSLPSFSACFLRLLASLSNKIVDLVSGTKKKCKAWAKPPNIN